MDQKRRPNRIYGEQFNSFDKCRRIHTLETDGSVEFATTMTYLQLDL